MLKVLIVMDSFKGSLSSKEAIDAVASGIYESIPSAKVIKRFCGDGGEGTVDAFVSALGGMYANVMVHDPYMRPLLAQYGVCSQGELLIAEMSAASGYMTLTDEERNIQEANTYGTGELLMALIAKNPKKIILGLGGSATNDGGIGALSAMGIDFFDEAHRRLEPKPTNMSKVASLSSKDLWKQFEKVELILACDVDNPMTGSEGASLVFGPQKGGTPELLKSLDHGMAHFGWVLENAFGKRFVNSHGAGAAGGLAGGLLSFLPCSIKSGAELLIEILKIEELVRAADLVITGEGRLDQQSLMGKLPGRIAELAKKNNKPLWAIVGENTLGIVVLNAAGFTRVDTLISRGGSIEKSMENADAYLRAIGKTIDWE